MAKPECWRQVVASYPVQIVTPTRFQDLDTNGHINNVAFAALFENARVRMNREARPLDGRPDGERTMVATVTINYLREGRYPDDMLLASGVGHIGTSSWSFVQAMFQNGACIATCDSVIVCRKDSAAQPLRQTIRDWLEANRALNDV